MIATRLVHDNRLLKYLLSHLKPERYGRGGSPGSGARETAREAAGAQAAGMAVLEDRLRAMEPALPAPPEQLLDPEALADELALADAADGVLPRFLAEQRAPKSASALAAEERAARDARGLAALKKSEAGGELTMDKYADQCYLLDPVSNARPRPRRRQGADGVTPDSVTLV